jgi:hypothetical protein
MRGFELSESDRDGQGANESNRGEGNSASIEAALVFGGAGVSIPVLLTLLAEGRWK